MNLHFRCDDVGGIAEKWEPHVFNMKIVEGLEVIEGKIGRIVLLREC